MARKIEKTGIIIFLLAAAVFIAASAAVAETIICDYCGQVINGRYMVSEGKNYHVDCYRNHVAFRCALCGEIINGEYFEDFWGNKVHAEHKGVVPQCEYCRRFLSDKTSNGWTRYDDGRLVCGFCAESAIKDISTAQAIMTELQRTLKGAGIETTDQDIPLYLVNKHAMKDLAAGFHADPLGFANLEQTSYVGGLVKDRSMKIYMMTNLPRFEFISALAHELMHTWLFVYADPDIDPAMREGTCNYAGYLALQSYRDRDAQFVVNNMLSDPDPIYGDGFRKVKSYVDSHGFAAWLKYLKKHTEPPW